MSIFASSTLHPLLKRQRTNVLSVCALGVLCCIAVTLVGHAQENAGVNQPVLIQRQSLALTSPEVYRVAVQLEPIRSVTVTAQFDGTVDVIAAKVGQKVAPDFELLRLDDRRSHLMLLRAEASEKLAETKLRLAQISKDTNQLLLAEAETNLAKAEVNLAKYDLNHASVKSTYGGTVLEIHVSEGQRFKAGEPLITFGDLKQLKCRLPVDRDKAKSGSTTSLTVESQKASGKVRAVLPLPDSSRQLRDLAVSVAIAEIEIDNAQGKFQPGQLVFTDLIPKFPVARVPLESVKTADAGGRVVQVLRENVVRDVAVSLHGQIGDQEVFVSGSFSEHDEVIRTTSVVLTDGMAVKPSSADRFATSNNSGGNRANPRQKQQTNDVKPNAGGF